jgi:nucleotide-binding universal stress UspA family protein
MIRTIMVPLDGSKRAERILPYVAEMARRLNASLFLLQVVEPNIESSGSQAAHQEEAIKDFRQRTNEAEIYLNGIDNQWQAQGLRVQNLVAHGDIVKTILRIAQSGSVDLIAMASHGRTGISRVFYGSITAGILQQVDRPLLVIRSEGEEEQNAAEISLIKKILVPLDGSRRAERILPYVEELAHSFDARVVFLRVVEIDFVYTTPLSSYTITELRASEHVKLRENAEVYLGGLKGEFREKGIQASSFVADPPVVGAIINAVEREGADLIALASHGRTGLARVFYGSVAAGVLHQIDRPLLLIRAEDHS